MRKIGLIAGGGTLPVRIIEACKAAGHQITTVALSNHADDVLPFADAVLRMGAAGDIISHFRAAGVTELVMAGPVRRPSLSEIRPDAWGAKFLFRSGAGLLGDDGLLTAIAKALEKEGFQVIGAGDLLSDILAGDGQLAGPLPDAEAEADIRRGIDVLAALAPVDVGQAVVIQAGLVLGVEAVEGTDALIRRCGLLKREGAGPVLIKAPKQQQDRRVDLPTVGLSTVQAMIENGFSGLAVEAGGTMIMEREAVIETADKAGFFLFGFSPEAD